MKSKCWNEYCKSHTVHCMCLPEVWSTMNVTVSSCWCYLAVILSKGAEDFTPQQDVEEIKQIERQLKMRFAIGTQVRKKPSWRLCIVQLYWKPIIIEIWLRQEPHNRHFDWNFQVCQNPPKLREPTCVIWKDVPVLFFPKSRKKRLDKQSKWRLRGSCPAPFNYYANITNSTWKVGRTLE